MTRTAPIAIALALGLTLAACSTSRDEAPAPTVAPAATAASASAQPPAPLPSTGNPDVGGAPMLPTRTIAENAVQAPTLSTLVAALRAADLTATLSGPGPFTVFAPTNDAFGRLAPGTVDSLLKPENKASLVKLLTYHVVPGTITAQQLMDMIRTGGGTATLTTVAGQPIRATMTGSVITLTSATGNQSYVEIADVRQSNGIVHVVNGVLVPTLA